MATWLDTDRDQHCTVAYTSCHADFLVASIDDEIFDLIERAISPDFEFFIKQLCGAADLGAGDVQATQLGCDFGDFSRGNALDIHFCDGKFQSFFTSFSAFQSRWIEISISGLRNFQLKLAESRFNGFRLESIGIGTTLVGSLVGLSAEVLGAFNLHGFVEENLHRVGHSFEAIVG